ncbi:MAG: hypothetical protein U9N59_09360 [Campylobacterota bacterium]|nr:hypothetical protein [Campylobacterota bacterium]
MAVKFISHVEQDEIGGWYIKLTDTLEETEVICKDLEEYTLKIEELGGEYGGDIEVVWTRSQLLTPANYQDLNEKMAELQEKYKDEIDKINEQNSQANDEMSGFNPNG